MNAQRLAAPTQTTGLEARPLAGSGRGLTGRIQAPGDKSISHRALILGAMASGATEIEGLLPGDDVMATLAAVRAFRRALTDDDIKPYLAIVQKRLAEKYSFEAAHGAPLSGNLLPSAASWNARIPNSCTRM